MKRSSRTIIVLSLLGCLGLGGILCEDATAADDRRAVIARSRALLADAQTSFAAGETDSALIHLQQVLEEDPANPDAYYFIGLISLSLSDTSGAEVALTEGVRLAPMSRRLKLLLALVWVKSGNYDEAEKLINEVTALRPKDLDALYLQGLIALARDDSAHALEIWDHALAEELGSVEQ